MHLHRGLHKYNSHELMREQMCKMRPFPDHSTSPTARTLSMRALLQRLGEWLSLSSAGTVVADRGDFQLDILQSNRHSGRHSMSMQGIHYPVCSPMFSEIEKHKLLKPMSRAPKKQRQQRERSSLKFHHFSPVTNNSLCLCYYIAVTV